MNNELLNKTMWTTFPTVARTSSFRVKMSEVSDRARSVGSHYSPAARRTHGSQRILQYCVNAERTIDRGWATLRRYIDVWAL